MTALIFTESDNRIATLRKLYTFVPGGRGTAIYCGQCDARWWVEHASFRQECLRLLDLLDHGDAHPSF